MANGKLLRDLKRGDKVYLSSGVVVDVTRANPKSLSTSDGNRWDYRTNRRVGDPGYGTALTAEPFDDGEHPYRNAARKARELARYIHSARASSKPWASVLPDLERVLEVLNGKR
jgi:hypothetical protein